MISEDYDGFIHKVLLRASSLRVIFLKEPHQLSQAQPNALAHLLKINLLFNTTKTYLLDQNLVFLSEQLPLSLLKEVMDINP